MPKQSKFPEVLHPDNLKEGDEFRCRIHPFREKTSVRLTFVGNGTRWCGNVALFKDKKGGTYYSHLVVDNYFGERCYVLLPLNDSRLHPRYIRA